MEKNQEHGALVALRYVVQEEISVGPAGRTCRYQKESNGHQRVAWTCGVYIRNQTRRRLSGFRLLLVQFTRSGHTIAGLKVCAPYYPVNWLYFCPQVVLRLQPMVRSWRSTATVSSGAWASWWTTSWSRTSPLIMGMCWKMGRNTTRWKICSQSSTAPVSWTVKWGWGEVLSTSHKKFIKS